MSKSGRFAKAFVLLLLLAPGAEAFEGKVVRVLDGDTLEVLREKKTLRVRLNGIDCPEKTQAFGTKAKEFTSELCFGKTVEVDERGHDRYGRTIAEVKLSDGRDLNQELVRSGMAWWYRKFAAKDETLENLEEDARKRKVGLWSDPKAEPPWEFRDKKK